MMMLTRGLACSAERVLEDNAVLDLPELEPSPAADALVLSTGFLPLKRQHFCHAVAHAVIVRLNDPHRGFASDSKQALVREQSLHGLRRAPCQLTDGGNADLAASGRPNVRDQRSIGGRKNARIVVNGGAPCPRLDAACAASGSLQVIAIAQRHSSDTGMAYGFRSS
jgi:hypothetical protein